MTPIESFVLSATVVLVLVSPMTGSFLKCWADRSSVGKSVLDGRSFCDSLRQNAWCPRSVSHFVLDSCRRQKPMLPSAFALDVDDARIDKPWIGNLGGTGR